MHRIRRQERVRTGLPPDSGLDPVRFTRANFPTLGPGLACLAPTDAWFDSVCGRPIGSADFQFQVRFLHPDGRVFTLFAELSLGPPLFTLGIGWERSRHVIPSSESDRTSDNDAAPAGPVGQLALSARFFECTELLVVETGNLGGGKHPLPAHARASCTGQICNTRRSSCCNRCTIDSTDGIRRSDQHSYVRASLGSALGRRVNSCVCLVRGGDQRHPTAAIRRLCCARNYKLVAVGYHDLVL